MVQILQNNINMQIMLLNIDCSHCTNLANGLLLKARVLGKCVLSSRLRTVASMTLVINLVFCVFVKCALLKHNVYNKRICFWLMVIS